MDLSRRQLLKTFGCAGAGITLSALGLDVREVRAATKDFKLEGAKEYTSICTFCACGCSMLCSVKDGKLINLEGDPDSIINEGALCSKGVSMGVIPNSDQRGKTPLYRAPGSDKWQEISWDEAIDKVAKKMKADQGRQLDRHREGRHQGQGRTGVQGKPHRRHLLPGGGAEPQRRVLPLVQVLPHAGDGLRGAPGPGLTQPHRPQFGGIVRPRRNDQPLARPAACKGVPHRGEQRR